MRTRRVWRSQGFREFNSKDRKPFHLGGCRETMDAHRRYLQQAAWTAQLRAYLLNKAGLSGALRVLEVGCGTGVILQGTANLYRSGAPRGMALHGADLDPEALQACRRNEGEAFLSRADAGSLPYASGVFDITFCHFLLLWVKQPVKVLQEMRRVTRRGGYVMAMAEPDYGARIDKPLEFVQLGEWQRQALIRQGADASTGSRLAGLFRSSGMSITETGTLVAWQPSDYSEEDAVGEWQVLWDDIGSFVPESELLRLQDLDLVAAPAWRARPVRPHVLRICSGIMSPDLSWES